MKTINFSNGLIVSKEELKEWDSSNRELLGDILRYGKDNSTSGFILDLIDEFGRFVNDFFLTSVGTNVSSNGRKSLHIGEGRGILNIDGELGNLIPSMNILNNSLLKQRYIPFSWPDTDNIQLSLYSSGDEVYVGFIPEISHIESGNCVISSNNQVTITGGDFTLLRGHNTKVPSKIKFVKSDGTPATNNQIYEVVEIIDDTTIVISGQLVNESSVYMLIVGSYDLSVQGDLANRCSYVNITGKLVYTTGSEIDITGDGGFVIAKLTFSTGGDYVITDLRETNLFNLATNPNSEITTENHIITGIRQFQNFVYFEYLLRHVFDTVSLTTPLVVDYDAYPHPKVEISKNSLDGNIVTMTIIEGAFFDTIKFNYTPDTGTRFLLKIIIPDEGTYAEVRPYDAVDGIRFQSPSTTVIKIKRSVILDVLRDSDGRWLIMNSDLNYTS